MTHADECGFDTNKRVVVDIARVILHFYRKLDMKISFVIVLVTLMMAGLTFVCSRKIIDLTHVLDEETPKLPLIGYGFNVTQYGYNLLAAQYFGDAW